MSQNLNFRPHTGLNVPTPLIEAARAELKCCSTSCDKSLNSIDVLFKNLTYFFAYAKYWWSDIVSCQRVCSWQKIRIRWFKWLKKIMIRDLSDLLWSQPVPTTVEYSAFAGNNAANCPSLYCTTRKQTLALTYILCGWTVWSFWYKRSYSDLII